MAQSIEQAHQEVQAAFTAALAWADGDERRSFAAFESRGWTLVLAIGRALVRVFLARPAQRVRPLAYRHGGRAYQLADWRVSELGTRFGKVSFERPVGRPPEDRRAAADLLVDRDLGLCSGFTLGVVTGVTRLVAQMAFGVARETYREIYEWAPSPRAVLRMVDAVGAGARRFLEQAAVPADDDDGEILLRDAIATAAEAGIHRMPRGQSSERPSSTRPELSRLSTSPNTCRAPSTIARLLM